MSSVKILTAPSIAIPPPRCISPLASRIKSTTCTRSSSPAQVCPEDEDKEKRMPDQQTGRTLLHKDDFPDNYFLLYCRQ